MKIQRLTSKRIKWEFYKLQYLALKSDFKSHLKILQGMGFLRKIGKSCPVTNVSTVTCSFTPFSWMFGSITVNDVCIQ